MKKVFMIIFLLLASCASPTLVKKPVQTSPDQFQSYLSSVIIPSSYNVTSSGGYGSSGGNYYFSYTHSIVEGKIVGCTGGQGHSGYGGTTWTNCSLTATQNGLFQVQTLNQTLADIKNLAPASVTTDNGTMCFSEKKNPENDRTACFSNGMLISVTQGQNTNSRSALTFEY